MNSQKSLKLRLLQISDRDSLAVHADFKVDGIAIKQGSCFIDDVPLKSD